MKKYIRISFIYAIIAICCGVFYREFTKFTGFTGKTTLSVTHLHFFVLGTVVFLLVALLTEKLHFENTKTFKAFMIIYNAGLPFMVVMFFVRGILQVVGASLSSGASAAISGLAGIAHTTLTVGIILLFVSLLKGCNDKSK